MLQTLNNHSMQFEIYQQNIINDFITTKDKNDNLHERIMEFAEISTLQDAKLLSKKILPTNGEACTFYTNKAKCTVINKINFFSLTYNSEDEYICFRFDDEGLNDE